MSTVGRLLIDSIQRSDSAPKHPEKSADVRGQCVWFFHCGEVSPAADAQSRTYRVKLTLEAPTSQVRLGMTADVAFPQATSAALNGSSQQAFTLPSTALFHDGNLPAVWVVKAGDALELRRVQVSRYGERTVTISQGLASGERVVWQGVHTLSAGEKVRVVAPLHPEDFAS